MKKLLTTLCSMFFLLAGFDAAAADAGTANDATALVKKAVAFYKQAGKEKALAEFNKPGSAYIDRDLYIFVIDMDGKTLANGVNPKIVGKNVIDMKDADGKPFIKQFIDIAKTKGSGWLDYQWPDPVTKSVRPKSTYVEKVDDVVIGCGVYK
jgi:cytochrome c